MTTTQSTQRGLAPAAPIAVPRPPVAAPRPGELNRQIDERLDRAERLLAETDLPAVELCVSVVMPVYNRRDVIEGVVERMLAAPMPVELVVVDDGSTDGTADVLDALAERLPIRVIRHSRRRGDGAALRSGLAAATGNVIAIEPVDSAYDPAELPVLIKPIALRCCDVVFGSRYLAPLVDDRARLHRLGNRLLTSLSNLCTGQNLTDIEAGQKVFRRELLRGLVLRQNRFGCQAELTAKLARRGGRIYELPIRTAIPGEKARKIRLVEALGSLWCILRYALAD